MFFVATAPGLRRPRQRLAEGLQGHLRRLDDKTVAYLDLYGSGAETIAHLRDNGRITVMFCSFARRPKILRLYGTGRVVRRTHGPSGTNTSAGRFGSGHAGYRAIVVVDVGRVADSCGYSVPFMELAGRARPAGRPATRRAPEEWGPARPAQRREHRRPTGAGARPPRSGSGRQRTSRSVNG